MKDPASKLAAELFLKSSLCIFGNFKTYLETLKHAQIFTNICVYVWQEVVRGLFSGFFTNRRNSLPPSSGRWKLDDRWSGNVSVTPVPVTRVSMVGG